MSEIESNLIEKRLAFVRQKMKSVAAAGDGRLAKAYGEEVLSLLKKRDPKNTQKEEFERGLL